jgi:hypothetical protein
MSAHMMSADSEYILTVELIRFADRSFVTYEEVKSQG